MRYGSPYGTCYGDPTKLLAYVRTRLCSGAVEVAFQPRTDEGDTWFGIYVNGRKALHVYADEGLEKVVRVPLPWGSAQASVHVIPLGFCGDAAADFSHLARGVEAGDSKRVTLHMAYVPVALDPDAEEDSGYTASWSLTGLDYGSNIERYPPYLTLGRLSCAIVVAAGTVTVTLSAHGVPVAEGTIAEASLPGSVTLAAKNGSGLTGSVTVAVGAADTTFDVFARWPKQMRVLRDTSSPPSTVVATLSLDRKSVV
jgi:hypothetical protein